MKKVYVLLALILCAMLAFSAQAVEAKPGDTVQVPISIGASEAYSIRIGVTFDNSVFEYAAIKCTAPGGTASYNVENNSGKMVSYSTDTPIPGGQFGYITLKVKDSAKSGTYAVSVSLLEAIDTNYLPTSVSVSAGSVTVLCMHPATEEKTVKEPDCVNPGTMNIVCSDCGKVMEEKEIPALDHTYGNYIETTPATCTTAGEKTAKCVRCDAKLTEAIPALDHKLGAYAVTTPATCTEKGVETAKCERCDYAETKEIAALNHKLGAYAVTTPATCTEKGVETAKCERCDYTETKEIAALNHKLGAYAVTTPATCTEKGVETAKCERCDYTETKDIPALDHERTDYVVTKEPTCTEDGVSTSKCIRCSDALTEKIDKLGHELGAYTVTKEATCLEDGVKTAKCVRCDYTKTETITKLGHDMGAYTVTKAATCLEDGVETSKCSRCDYTETKTIKKLGHDMGTYTVTKAATCLEDGVETSECSRCDHTQTRAIKKLGHKFSNWIVEKAATCLEEGKEYRTCSRCSEREERTVKALGHNAVWKTIKPATGKEEGLKQKICKRCNEILDEQIIPIRKVAYKTASTAGFRMDELTNLIDKNDAWKMLTPIDFSTITVEEPARYPLVAGNVYEIGYVEVKVDEEGVITAEIVIDSEGVVMYSSALVLLTDVSEIERFTANDYEHYEFPVSIKLEDLSSEKYIMMVTCQLTLNESRIDLKYYDFKSEEHLKLMESLNAILYPEDAAEEAAE